MKSSWRSIYYVLITPIIYILFSAIMKGSLHAIDWKTVILVTIASIIGVALGNLINKKL